jgi:hypothetical protein
MPSVGDLEDLEDFELAVEAEEIEEDRVLVGAIVSFFEAVCKFKLYLGALVERDGLGKEGFKDLKRGTSISISSPGGTIPT